ncbi:vanadium-dependent haloperoxidase [Archangium violaceum]|uniref:vanadium-dependent haloperoxidase n=1 Tax=Archangium violaceum TaxID=83451 RepID=UPI00193BD658|nr:vanadium-dependent haloperoxidase [Archangium violaceum]QRK07445.1 vanadium-dependent haloperoxidase [Archangium violaceum]
MVAAPCAAHANVVAEWNHLMLRLEPTPRFTPHTRGAALMHVAMHDALNSIPGSRRYTTYLPPVPASAGASPEAAASAAAHWTLRRYTQTVHPENTALLGQIETLYTTSLASIPDGPAKEEGIRVGEAAAEQLWTVRANDGWNNPDNLQYTFPAPAPGVWRPVPPWPSNNLPPFFWWNRVTPWTLIQASQFMSPPPLDITSERFQRDVAETRAYGDIQSTVRTADQSLAAHWWGTCVESNFGSPGLIAQQLVLDHGTGLYESARIFAILALVQADAIISNIENKNRWNFWRPITVIRENGDVSWTPFLTTPPNQEYPAGHPMVSGAGVYVLAKFFPGRLKQPLRVTSASCGTRTFLHVSDAVDEVVSARVWGGMHFRHSGEVGAGLGKKIAHWVYKRYLLPLDEPHLP